MATTHYKRPLPNTAVAFASPEGRQLFAEALTTDGMVGYFPLAEQFHTQSEPAYCGLGSLVMALNALGIDPGRLWKGAWRRFAEDMLDCCLPVARSPSTRKVLSERPLSGGSNECSRPEAVAAWLRRRLRG